MSESTPTPEKVPTKPGAIRGCLGCFGLIVLLSVVGAFCSGAMTTPRKPIIPIGTQAHVQNDTHTVLTMGLSEAAFEQLSKAVAANDRLGAQQVLMSGQFVELPSGTSVLVLGYNLWQGITQVRVLSGNQTGKAGWVWNDYVVP